MNEKIETFLFVSNRLVDKERRGFYMLHTHKPECLIKFEIIDSETNFNVSGPTLKANIKGKAVMLSYARLYDESDDIVLSKLLVFAEKKFYNYYLSNPDIL